MTNFVSIKDLHHVYPRGVEALRGVSLDVDLGEFVAIMGENGSGKTTLLKHFNGLLKPTKGHVIIDGIDTKELTVAELARKVGYVFQNPIHQLFTNSVEKEISLGFKALKLTNDEINRRIDELLNTFGLEKYRLMHPLALSEGEKKRVALISVLAMNPNVIILDEPTLGQDAKQKRRLASFLREQLPERTVIIASHDTEFVVDNVDRIVILSKGKILADDKTRNIIKRSDVLVQASLALPQIPTLASILEKCNFPTDTLTVEEAFEALIPLIQEFENTR